MDLGLDGAPVCVQGGTKGMGRAAAECFAADGARVVVLARGQEAIDETVARLTEFGSPEAFGVSTDIADPAAVATAFEVIDSRWGSLNTLVCAAGPMVSQADFEDVTEAMWLEAYSLGTLGAVRCARGALPLLRRADWARIVNVSAMSTRSHGHGLTEYTAAKSALNSVTKNLSLELGPEGILVNAVSPGTFVSDQLREFLATVPDGPAPDDLTAVMSWITEQFHVRCDVGRAGDPAEIGPAICFLGSRRNTYITGANLNVDGGSAFL